VEHAWHDWRNYTPNIMFGKQLCILPVLSRTLPAADQAASNKKETWTTGALACDEG